MSDPPERDNSCERYQEALDAYQQAIYLDPNDAFAYNGKGLALEQLGQHREAQQAYQKAKNLKSLK